jgi:hypothetical protein
LGFGGCQVKVYSILYVKHGVDFNMYFCFCLSFDYIYSIIIKYLDEYQFINMLQSTVTRCDMFSSGYKMARPTHLNEPDLMRLTLALVIDSHSFRLLTEFTLVAQYTARLLWQSNIPSTIQVVPNLTFTHSIGVIQACSEYQNIST